MFSALLLSFPHIDPVLIQLGPFAVRWYALAYLAGILLGYEYIRRMNRRLTSPLLSNNQADDMMIWAIIGIMLGGRLGYVLFYKADYYLQNPSEIIAVWQGGMAFHGGLLGVIAAFYLFARRHQLSYLRLMDMVACAAPIGLFFGRIANFINGELFGRVANCSLCMVFPHGGPLPRHPSQLYEAALEGLLLFVLLWFLRFRTDLPQRAGALAGVFLLGYSAARTSIELFRQPDAHLGFVVSGVTMGQLLSLPMALVGLYLIVRKTKDAPQKAKHAA